jgi:DNA-binding NarL/FixJ family response regulator
MNQELCASGATRLRSVLIVDDHPLYSDALAAALSLSFKDCVIRQVGTLEDTFEALDEGFAPDLIMFDLKLPDVTGISGFRELQRRAPDARILVISSLAAPELVDSLLEEGAAGFLPKDSPSNTLRHAVREIESGRRYVPESLRQRRAATGGENCAYRSNPKLSALTPQQTRILKLICAGKPNKQIAYELDLAEATVKAHITALLRRLGVSNRTQAVVAAETALVQHGGSEPEARAFLQH